MPGPLADSLAGPPLPEYVADIDSLPIGGYDPSTQLTGDSQVLALGPSSPSDSQRAVGAHIEAILSTLALHIHVNPQLAPLNVNHTFKRAVQLAVDRAVREVSGLLILFTTFLTSYFPDHSPRCRKISHHCWDINTGTRRQGLCY